MGVLYYACNLETKKAYELGKGDWYRLSKKGFIDASDAEKLREEITEKVITTPQWDDETVNNVSYHKMIAISLSLLGNKLELVSDDMLESLGTGFVVIGTRYN